MGRSLDLTGQHFGRLTAIERSSKKKHGAGTYWVCRCECGNEVIVRCADLRSGNSKSCGCLRTDKIVEACTKHGMARSSLYAVHPPTMQKSA